MKPSLLLACAAWVSFFAISFALIFHALPADAQTLIPYAALFFVAVVAGSVASPRKEK